MARRVFFSFHYEDDVNRAFVVRNSWMMQANRETGGFVDHAQFEAIKRNGDRAVHHWIDEQLVGSSVTVVLIGAETLYRPYVQYEIRESYARGNGLLGIYINNIKNFQGFTSGRCSTGNLQIGTKMGLPVYFSGCPVYDWIGDNGYTNLGTWVEQAARNAGRS